MKKLFSLIVLTGLLAACNNSSSTSKAKDTTMSNPTNVQNVNGNVPDTTSGTNLEHPLPVDSSKIKDSAKK
jgi:ABC-type oligopeptide transport system substrate-binding subunit